MPLAAAMGLEVAAGEFVRPGAVFGCSCCLALQPTAARTNTEASKINGSQRFPPMQILGQARRNPKLTPT